MKNFSVKYLEIVLRIGIFMTFLGHGVLAVNGKLNWIPYLEVVGIPHELAQKLIVIIGYLDIIVASVVLFKPYKVVVIWAAIWAFSTAVIRPVSGEPIWDFVERGANWAVPLCLFILLKYKNK